jgi:hypothetical protein
MRCWLLALLVLACGCVPREAYVGVEYVPPDYAHYPHTYYDDRVTYYIGGRWYTRRDGGWVYFREEPPELYRYRRHVEQAPRAYPRRNHERHEHRRHERESAPPAYSAPPADRVR